MNNASINKNSSAKYAFFYMLSLVSLVFTAISVGIIIFQIINKNIEDPLSQWSGSFDSGALKFAISALLVAAPIFYATSRQIFKSLFSGKLDKEAGVRRWLTYFIIFVTSVVMIGWMIGIINMFLGGELTLKFILKALTAIMIAAAVFSFYLYDIKRKEVSGKKDKAVTAYFYGSLIIIVGVFTSSLFIVESPKETRNRKTDEAVINNFSEIDSAMKNYYLEYEKLPENLDVLVLEVNFLSEDDIVHPVEKEKYEYKKTGDRSYELCVEFKSSNVDNEDIRYKNERWLHDAGYQCIEQKIINKANNQPIVAPEPVEID